QVLSTVTDPSQIQAALAFAKAYDDQATAYDNLFKTITVDSVRHIGPFETVLNQLNDQFDSLTKSAQQYGLPQEPIDQGYQAAKERLAADFNETMVRAIQQLKDPAQAAVDEEKRAGTQRVQDAKAVAADLATVDEYNAANLKKLTDDQARAIAEFAKSIQTSFGGVITSIANQVGPFEQAFDRMNESMQTLTEQAVAAGRSTEDIAAAASTAQASLKLYFNDNINQLTKAITDPVQAAIDIENRAGQQRVRDATVVGGDLDAVAKYNAANLQKITVAAEGAVNTLASAQQIAASAATTLAAVISNVTTG